MSAAGTYVRTTCRQLGIRDRAYAFVIESMHSLAPLNSLICGERCLSGPSCDPIDVDQEGHRGGIDDDVATRCAFETCSLRTLILVPAASTAASQGEHVAACRPTHATQNGSRSVTGRDNNHLDASSQQGMNLCFPETTQCSLGWSSDYLLIQRDRDCPISTHQYWQNRKTHPSSKTLY